MTGTTRDTTIGPAAPPLHALALPVFTRYLGQLAGLVDAAQAHAAHRGLPDSALLGARLAPDMLPFAAQVAIAAQFALRSCHPLSGRAVPAWPGVPGDFAALAAAVARAREAVQALPPSAFDGAEHARCTSAPARPSWRCRRWTS
jgi:hypothetical protein